ncbi:phospholipase A2 inhibitor and Ly6/PLAUR domain-containing protein-like isoform X2 [Dendropsophus ebraccatus]|uniref:phospholipase A2 inhibitor and Ly6/PLAUR domain-containing protein-like isoform X2 n=1 Tax=Dendropsophus ebraccatus TaxID=150705 RepID=UPI00383130E4
MMSMTGILSLLSALIATSDALSCTQCYSESSSCSGPSVTCPLDHQCGSTYTETTAGGVKNVVTYRACTKTSECNFNGSVSVNGGKVKRVTSCCNTDFCTPTTPPLPKTSYNFNGVVCPCCTSASDWCYTTETIRCTGDENRCILQIVEIPDLGSTVLRGCATQSMCDDGSVSESVDGLSVNMKITCTNGGRGVH